MRFCEEIIVRLCEEMIVRICEEMDETSVHILTECVELNNPRTLYLEAYQIENSDLPNLELFQVLHFLGKVGLEGSL